MIYIQYSYCSETFLTTKTSVLKADCQDNAHTFFLMDLEHLMYSPCQCNTGSNVKTTQTHTKLQCMHVCYVHLTDLCNTNLYGYIFFCLSAFAFSSSLCECVCVCACGMFLHVHVYAFLLGTQTPLGDYTGPDKADRESAPGLHSCRVV